jgi:uncharacterized protein involved in exopolysaccharide biosynthesis
MESAELRPRLPRVEPTFMHAFLRYLAVLVRYRVFILVITALGGLIALGVCAASVMLPAARKMLPNEYTADATILVQDNPSGDLTANMISAITNANQESSAPVGFEYSSLVLRMLRSRVILDQVLQDFDIDRHYHLDGAPKSLARRLLLGRARFTYAKAAGTITISYRDTDPVFARDVVNRIVLLLNDWFNQIYGASTANQRAVLEKKMSDVQAQIAGLEDRVKTLQEQYGFLNPQDLALQLRGAGASPKDLADVAQQYANLSQQLDVQRGIYASLSHQVEMAKLSLNPVPSFQILEMAETPDHKSGPNRISLIGTVLLACFFSSVVLSFLFNFVRTVRADPETRRILLEGRSRAALPGKRA